MTRAVLTIAIAASALLFARELPAQEHHHHDAAPAESTAPSPEHQPDQPAPPEASPPSNHQHDQKAPAETPLSSEHQHHQSAPSAEPTPPADHQHHHSSSPPSSDPTASELEHIPPDPPTTQDNHSMSYREMARTMEMDDTSATGMVLIDRLEWRNAKAGDALAWNAEAWYGNDSHKLLLKSEGVRHNSETTARTELLWDKPIARWWTLQAGARHDSAIERSRDWLAVGVQGLAPGFIDLEATAYIGDSGRAAARLSAGRDVLFTQRLILQPEVEMNLYTQGDPINQIGAGVSDLEVALRLRYEIRREFATYVGVVWARHFGDTATLARAADDDPSDVQFAAGVRIWF